MMQKQKVTAFDCWNPDKCGRYHPTSKRSDSFWRFVAGWRAV